MPALQVFRHACWYLLLCLNFVTCVGQAFGQSPDNNAAAPWDSAVAATGDLPSFSHECFVPFDTTKSLPQAEDLRQWFDVIAGQPQGIFETRTRRGQTGGIEGIVRLKSPWPADAAFKFALEDYNRLQFHFFRGDSGVTLVYHEDDLFRWSAYLTQRQPRGVTPSKWILVGTDDYHNRRTNSKNHDQYELRCIRDELVLSRGDVVLLRAPFSGPPDDVFLQGKAAFHGIALVRTRDFPGAAASVADSPGTDRPGAEGRSIRPVDIPWVQQLDERAGSELQPDGGIRLSSPARPKKRSWIATPIPRDAPAEYLLEIDQATPGAGIYLGNAKDGPRFVLRYATDQRSKLLCLLVRHDDDLFEHEFRGLTDIPLPVVAPHHWLRLVFGAGQLRWWISPDGVHWAEPVEPIRNLPPEVTHIGLHCVSRQAETSVTLRKMVIRELPGLSQLAPAELRQLSVARTSLPSLGAWLSDITELTPAGADTDTWRRACAWKSLAAGCPRGLANDLLMLLLGDPFTRRLPLDEQLRVLADAALLIDVWDDHGLLQKFGQLYFEAGDTNWRRTATAPFSSIRHAFMTSPFASRHQLDVAPDESLRLELAQLAYSRDWLRLRGFARELRFFQLNSKAPLLDWAEGLALRNLPAEATGELALTKQKDEWRALLVEELNKDVYNALAQLRVELSGAGREDAARAIAAFDSQLVQGIAPHWQDNQLLVSLPAAVREVLQDDADLRRVLADQYSEIAKLRLRQAIDRWDRDAVSLVAWQFAPTEAATDAHLWLGDQALARGWFVQAAAEYRLAGKTMTPGLLTNVASKLRLAATLAGQDAGTPVAGTIAVGDSRLSADEFEKLIQEIAARQAGEKSRRVVNVFSPSPSVPQPAAYQVQRRARLDGAVGNDPNREFAKDTARRQLDWVDRQLGIAVESNWMYVSNRFQVAAYDLQSKQRVWQSPPPAGQVQFAQESTFIAARPLLTRDRIFVRLLYGSTATLGCLDRANGQFVWTTTPANNEFLISDPFFLSGQLTCLKMVRTEQQEAVVQLASFDPLTGNAWQEREIVRLRDAWNRRRCCELTQLDDGLVVLFGGVVVRLNTSGQVLWVRKQTTLPPDEDPQWVTQWFQPPLLAGDRLYVASPGDRSLDCLDQESGEVVWSRLMFDVERLVGIVGERLILQTGRGLMAVKVQDGTTDWMRDLDGLTAGLTCSADGGLLAVQRVPTDAARSRFRPRLVWVDSTSGTIRAVAGLADLEDQDPRIGPMVVDQDRIWTFWGRGQNDATRDVVELVPNGAAELSVAVPIPDPWERNLDPRLTDAAAGPLPQWRLLHAEFGERSGLLPEVHGEKDALGLRFRNSGPIVLGRRVTFPALGKPQLRVRFGNEPAQPWKLEVRFRGDVVWSQLVNPDSHPQPWKNFNIDLSQLAGREGWLTFRAFLPQPGDAPAYWKSLELVF